VVLGFDIEYGVQSKRAVMSVWRPRTVKDEEGGEEALILETVSDQETDVRPSDHLFLTKEHSSLICPLSSLSDLMTGPQSSIAAFAFSSAILHRQPASPIYRKKIKIQRSSPFPMRSSVHFARSLKLGTI
jgi:hypothetical protein